jgi:hypothetical protein
VRLVTGKMYDASASPEGPHYDNKSCLPFEPDDADPRDAQRTLPLLLGEGACGNVYAVRIRKDLLLKDDRTYSQVSNPKDVCEPYTDRCFSPSKP